MNDFPISLLRKFTIIFNIRKSTCLEENKETDLVKSIYASLNPEIIMYKNIWHSLDQYTRAQLYFS